MQHSNKLTKQGSLKFFPLLKSRSFILFYFLFSRSNSGDFKTFLKVYIIKKIFRSIFLWKHENSRKENTNFLLAMLSRNQSFSTKCGCFDRKWQQHAIESQKNYSFYHFQVENIYSEVVFFDPCVTTTMTSFSCIAHLWKKARKNKVEKATWTYLDGPWRTKITPFRNSECEQIARGETFVKKIYRTPFNFYCLPRKLQQKNIPFD